jgi:2-polyprenyl-3-methyl-5-hydroxy-6-metoxy-1,4-benzoquinol methylase
MRSRAEHLEEWMDDPACDPDRLARTYAQFARINALLSGWTGLYYRELRPALISGASTVLDVGCGGGDVLRYLARLARRDGLSVLFVGIDPDPRAIAFARGQRNPSDVCFEQADLCGYKPPSGFDLVISNHVLHHLKAVEIPVFCSACERLAVVKVVHNDLCRNDLALALFPVVGGWFRGSYILEDGLRSIRRAFTTQELMQLAPPGWKARPAFPFRLQLLWKP